MNQDVLKHQLDPDALLNELHEGDKGFAVQIIMSPDRGLAQIHCRCCGEHSIIDYKDAVIAKKSKSLDFHCLACNPEVVRQRGWEGTGIKSAFR